MRANRPGSSTFSARCSVSSTYRSCDRGHRGQVRCGARGRPARTRRPSRRQPARPERPAPRAPGSSMAVGVGASSRSARWSATTRLRSSGMRRLNERSPASTCASHGRRPSGTSTLLAPARRPGSSSCRRRRGRHPARARAPPAPGAGHLAGLEPCEPLPTSRLTSGSGISSSWKKASLIAGRSAGRCAPAPRVCARAGRG